MSVKYVVLYTFLIIFFIGCSDSDLVKERNEEIQIFSEMRSLQIEIIAEASQNSKINGINDVIKILNDKNNANLLICTSGAKIYVNNNIDNWKECMNKYINGIALYCEYTSCFGKIKKLGMGFDSSLKRLEHRPDWVDLLIEEERMNNVGRNVQSE